MHAEPKKGTRIQFKKVSPADVDLHLEGPQEDRVSLATMAMAMAMATAVIEW